jgi:HupE/UreJ protein
MPSVGARPFAVALASLFLLVPSAYPANRPLPEDVNIQAIARQDPGRLELLVRVPLTAVKDIQFPTRGNNGELDLSAVESMLPGAAKYWIAGCFEVQEDGVVSAKPQVVKTRLSLISDNSFDSYDDAIAHMNAPELPPETDVSPEQVWLDVIFEYPLHSDRPVIAVRPQVAALGLRVATDVKYVHPEGGVRDFSFNGDPGWIFLDARSRDAAQQFLRWGFRFILRSADFLLFLFCLALALHRYREVAPSAIAFVAAISVPVLAGAFGITPDAIWLRPLVETLSAVAILLIAFANIVGHVTPRRRALFALSSGLIFGFICLFDFSAKVQFGGSHGVLSAFAFDVGAVAAVALLVALLVPVLSLLARSAKAERLEIIVFSALVADTAWGWLVERWSQLSKIPFLVPPFDARLLVLTLRCLTVLVLFGGALWFADGYLKSRQFSPADFSAKDKEGTAS